MWEFTAKLLVKKLAEPPAHLCISDTSKKPATEKAVKV